MPSIVRNVPSYLSYSYNDGPMTGIFLQHDLGTVLSSSCSDGSLVTYELCILSLSFGVSGGMASELSDLW